MSSEVSAPVLAKSSLVLAATITVSILSLTSLVWWNLQHLNNHLPIQDRITTVERLRGDILHLDEVLTMSAMMAAKTGDPEWRTRYKQAESRLVHVITQAVQLAPETEAQAASEQLESTNTALMDLETRAFELIGRGEQDQAWALLESTEYKKFKEKYSSSLRQLDGALEKVIAASRLDQQSWVWTHVAVITITATLLICLWVVVARQRLRWHRALLQSNEQLLGHAGLLTEANRRFQEQATMLGEQRAYVIALMNEANQAKQRAERHEAKLADRNKEMERFVYTVSHDLKNPLVTILGYATMLQGELRNHDNPKLDGWARRIVQAGQRMNDTVKDLIELSRVGHVPHEPTRVDLNNLIPEVLDGLQQQIDRYGAHVQIQPELPTVTADPHRIAEVFDNLITNALKHGCTHTDPRIEIGAIADGSHVKAFVRDHGEGIAERYHSKVFGLFQRLDSQAEGTGVGLAIVKRIVEAHGGRVWVESPVTSPELTRDNHGNNGAAFWISLPQTKPTEAIACNNHTP